MRDTTCPQHEKKSSMESSTCRELRSPVELARGGVFPAEESRVVQVCSSPLRNGWSSSLFSTDQNAEIFFFTDQMTGTGWCEKEKILTTAQDTLMGRTEGPGHEKKSSTGSPWYTRCRWPGGLAVGISCKVKGQISGTRDQQARATP